LLPDALVFVETPQYGLQFLDDSLNTLDYHKVLVIDAERLRRGEVTREQLADYDAVIPAALQSEVGLLSSQQEIARSYKVVAVLGFSEISVLPAAVLAERFGVIGIGAGVARACRNKLTMIEAITSAGIKCPRFTLTDSGQSSEKLIASLGGFPIICKPLMGFASFGVIKAESIPEFNSAVRRIKRSTRLLMNGYYGLDESANTRQVLLQSFVPGREVAIDGYVQGGKSHILAIIDKPDVSQGPFFADAMHITPTSLDAAMISTIQKNVRASVAAIGLDDSPFHIEARIHEGEFYLLELAARVAFVRCLRNALGIDAMQLMIALRLGKTPDVQPRRHRYAGSYCITPHEAGVFRYLENRERVLDDPRVLDIPIYVSGGQRVAPAPESTGDIGHVVACAETYQEVQEVLNRAKSLLKVVVH
jgi:biotin carboxylase